MMSISLYEIISNCARVGLGLQRTDGSMPAGRNGPWNDPETPVRNTGYWLILFLKAHEITGSQNFLSAAQKAINYLLRSECRPHNKTFFHRISKQKDNSNGLIGQAWSIEALTFAGTYLNRDDLLDVAKQVFLLHPFEHRIGLWSVVDTDGQNLGTCKTFNQQLWFATVGTMIMQHDKQPEIQLQVNRFLDMLGYHLQMYDSGLIRHVMSFHRTMWGVRPNLAVRDCISNLIKLEGREKKKYELSIGYHSFNLFAFGLLRQMLPTHNCWSEKKIIEALNYVSKPEYQRQLETNRFAYTYNPTGIEVAFAIDVFDGGETLTSNDWLNAQFAKCMNFDTWQMDVEALDPPTSAGRLYQAIRLPNCQIEITVPRENEILR